MRKKNISLATAAFLTISMLTGCASTASVSGETASAEPIAGSEEQQQDKEHTKNEQSGMGFGQSSDTSVEDIDFEQELSQSDMDTDFTDREKDSSYDEVSASHIYLKGTSITADGSGVSISDSVVTITDAGTYIISGTLNDGQIIVNAGDSDKVQLVLNDISVSCSNNAPIYIQQADKVFITLADGTTNQLSDGETYELEDDTNVDAVIFSKDDLALNGNGTLIIQASYKHGIVSKDDLVITSGTYQITSVEQALKAKDQLKILDGTFTIASGDTAIKAKNEDDTTLGNIYIAGGTFNIQAAEDGLNATGSIVVDSGTWTIDAGDDGFHADLDTVINDGEINISNCYEGLEGLRVVVNGGDITLYASDDGLNAASGTASTSGAGDFTPPERPNEDNTGDGQDMTPPERPNEDNSSDGQDMTPPERPDGDNTGDRMDPGKMGGGFPGMGGGSMENDTDAYIKITGGNLTIFAEGDGIDSNGSLLVTGGNTIVNGPTSNGDGALDYNGGAKVTGGTLIAIGSSGMLQTFGSESTQGFLTYTCSSSQAEGTQITLSDAQGNELYSYTTQKQFASIVLTLPELKTGETYTLTVGDHTENIIIS